MPEQDVPIEPGARGRLHYDKATKTIRGSATPHTPGPWITSEETSNSVTIRANGVEIASVYNEDIDRLSNEQRATARLIAAAPEMRDLLVALLDMAARHVYTDHTGSTPIIRFRGDYTVNDGVAITDARALLARIESR